MKNSNTTKNTTNAKLTAAQKAAITRANKKALKALQEVESKALATIEENSELQTLSFDEFEALSNASKVASYQVLSQRELDVLTALESADNTIDSKALAIIEKDFIDSTAKLEHATNSIESLVSNRIAQVAIELESKIVAVSETKREAMQKNIVNRLKANKAFANASATSLQLIVDNSSNEALEYLLNASNYKTASRILDAAKYLNSERHSSIIDYTLSALKRSSMQQTSINNLCMISNQCYARISNAVKALAFFDVITVKNAHVNAQTNVIDKLSKDTLVSLAK